MGVARGVPSSHHKLLRHTWIEVGEVALPPDPRELLTTFGLPPGDPKIVGSEHEWGANMLSRLAFIQVG